MDGADKVVGGEVRVARLLGRGVAGDVVRLDAKPDADAVRVLHRERADLRGVGDGGIRREVPLDDVRQAGVGRETDFVEAARKRGLDHLLRRIASIAPRRVHVVVRLHGGAPIMT